MTRAALLWNPAAGRGRGDAMAKRALALLAARGIEADARPIPGPGEAASMAREIARSGASPILALGGDGTHGEVAEGVLRSGARPTVAFLPGGTGNDFLAHFGVKGLADAVARVAERRTRALDVGLARSGGEERHFLSILATGLAADTTAAAERVKWLRQAAYVAAVPAALRRLRAPLTRLELDGRAIEGAFSLVAVCNTSRAGGGMRFAPDADPADGVFEVVALRGASRARVLALLPRLLRGTHIGDPAVFHARASRITIDPETPTDVEADGEPLGETPVEITVLRRALHLLV